LSLGPPHTPFRPPKDFDLYTPEEIRLRPNVPAPTPGVDRPNRRQNGPARSGGQNHQATARRDLAGYYGLCESLDHEVGRLTTFLKTSGLDADTLVVFTSDHGELAGSHGKYRKGEPEEESLHVPLIMRLPGTISAGSRSGALINSIDVMPTMLSLCGLPDPGTCSGRNMSAAVASGASGHSHQDAIYCEGKLTQADADEDSRPSRRRSDAADDKGAADNGAAGSPASWRTIVTDRFKLTVRGKERQVEHLFNLNDDPFELQNLAGSAEHRSVREELLEQLLVFRDESGDSWPQTPPSARAMYEDPTPSPGQNPKAR
ncbi:MAG: sulfatase-like hydrolase/transferase, partial [Planctomycetaceae bacterium]|nr:sulfatase-like hydrolase/transferase [Planctomycetaceae bacterium]